VSGWTPDEIASIGRATELQVASERADGTLRPFVTIWAVRAGDDVYIRSAYGRDNPWFQRALRSGQGRIRAGGVEGDVRFEVPGPQVADAVSAAYHAKCEAWRACWRLGGSIS
jgi:hypothetical protein